MLIVISREPTKKINLKNPKMKERKKEAKNKNGTLENIQLT